MIGGKAVVLDAETMQPGMSISYVAGRHGLSPSLMFRWRRLMSEGGKEAVRADDEVVAASDSAASKNGCVSSSGCWAARPRRSKSSRRRSNWRSIPEDTHDAGIIERRDAGRPQRGPLSALATSSSPVQSVAWSTRDRPMGTAGSPRS